MRMAYATMGVYMKIYDYFSKTDYEGKSFPASCKKSNELLIVCQTHEVSLLRDVFGFDESTVLNCTDLDESVRYTSFDGYDFISMIHIEINENSLQLREINLYISASYLVLVMPEHDSKRLHLMETKLFDLAKCMDERKGRINWLYYSVFSNLLADFSDTLESQEDNMQALSEEIVDNVNKTHFTQIHNYKNMTFIIKKQLRALSYLGEQILLDENKLIGKGQIHYFRSVNTRLKKLYDFSEGLYNFSNEMLHSYDSRLTMKTNDTVNKLTAITLFFGPLTVITGIYGMNFNNMPELKWFFGYPLALIIMVIISLIMFIIMKMKKWL